MDTLWQDIRYAARMLLKNRGVSLIALLTLALGIGANTAIFSVVNAVLLRPLPYAEPERLARIYTEFPTMDLRKFWVSPPEYTELAAEAKSWEGIGAWSPGGANVATSGEPLRVPAVQMTRSLLPTLRVEPVQGRNFTAEEDAPNGPDAAMISEGLWRRAFGARPGMIGEKISVDSRPYTLVGILPQSFVFPPGSNTPAQVFAPLKLNPTTQNRGNHFLEVVGRLRHGVTLEQARAEKGVLVEQWFAAKPNQHRLHRATHPVLMLPLQGEVVSASRAAVLTLMGAVGFVLLIACANVASLLLARAEARRREFAMRLALGASRWRLLRQFLVEGFVLALLGAALGTFLAVWGLDLILAASPESVPRAAEIQLHAPVLLFTLGISMLAALLFAVAPAMLAKETDLTEQLRAAGGRTSTTGRGNLVRRALVVSEIALALVLVIGSGLMLRAFWKLQQAELGFRPQGLLTFNVEIPGQKYRRNTPDRLQYFDRLRERLAAIPGASSAAYMSGLPPIRPINANDTDIEGYTAPPNGPFKNVDYWNYVSLHYFNTMGIRLLEGRLFEPADTRPDSPRVCVINLAMAKRFWKESPIGRRVNPGFDDSKNAWFTIVGIVEDTKNIGVERPAGSELYFIAATGPYGLDTEMNFVVRGEGDPLRLASDVRAAVRDADPEIPIVRMQTMSDAVGAAMVRPRFLSLLLGMFSAMALALAAVGTYGVMSFMVVQRTQEIGIRMALGAEKRDVLAMVMRQGGTLLGIGIALGLAGAFSLTRLISGLLFGITATDLPTYVTVIALLAVVGLAACAVPARRAARVDPMVALRYE